jgi:hypothetical protein
VEIVFAVFPTFEFVENTIGKWTKTLSAYEAMLMPDFAARINDLLIDHKSFAATKASHVC